MRIREIALTKLRGIQIKKPSYIYTLNKGIFRSYNPYDPCDFMFTDSYNNNNINNSINQTERLRRGSPIHTSSPTQDHHVPSGYEQLDEALGGGFAWLQQLDSLLVILGAKRHGDQGLRFTAGE